MRKFIGLLALCVVAPLHAATLYISEYVGPPAVSVYYQAASSPAITMQTVAVGGVSAQSAAFSSTTRLIRVQTDIKCFVVIGGTNPTATTSSQRMAADQTEYFVVAPGDKLAVIVSP